MMSIAMCIYEKFRRQRPWGHLGQGGSLLTCFFSARYRHEIPASSLAAGSKAAEAHAPCGLCFDRG
jgi:hypothetical protein